MHEIGQCKKQDGQKGQRQTKFPQLELRRHAEGNRTLLRSWPCTQVEASPQSRLLSACRLPPRAAWPLRLLQRLQCLRPDNRSQSRQESTCAHAAKLAGRHRMRPSAAGCIAHARNPGPRTPVRPSPLSAPAVSAAPLPDTAPPARAPPALPLPAPSPPASAASWMLRVCPDRAVSAELHCTAGPFCYLDTATKQVSSRPSGRSREEPSTVCNSPSAQRSPPAARARPARRPMRNQSKIKRAPERERAGSGTTNLCVAARKVVQQRVPLQLCHDRQQSPCRLAA